MEETLQKGRGGVGRWSWHGYHAFSRASKVEPLSRACEKETTQAQQQLKLEDRRLLSVSPARTECRAITLIDLGFNGSSGSSGRELGPFTTGINPSTNPCIHSALLTHHHFTPASYSIIRTRRDTFVNMRIYRIAASALQRS